MGIYNFLKTHKMSVLSSLLVVAAVLLGADPGFAMAVDPVELAPEANPSDNMNQYDANTNPGGRPADETLQTDEQGGKTQLQGKPATATDVRDAGLEAEDYDRDVDEFRKFRFPSETYFARQCRPVKVNSYVHGHYRTGSTDLEAIYNGSNVAITAGVTSANVKVRNGKLILEIPEASFTNPECLKRYATVTVKGASGYKKNADGEEIPDGELMLFVLSHKDGDTNITFEIVNPPGQSASGGGDSAVPATSTTITSEAVFNVMATAGSESQIRVDSETYLPEKFDVYLQKKIVTVTITDEFDSQDKKVAFKTRQVLANAEYNFKRECARTHWNGTMGRTDIMVPETGGREAVYFENGVLRQVNMLYTHGNDLTDDDLLALTTLMFTNNSMSDEATVFCGKKAMARLIKLVNSADKYKDVGKVEVNDYGIKVRNYIDNFGKLEFVWDPTLDDIGYEEYMVILDLRHATRPYKRNDTKTTRDMSKTGEAREAKEHNLCRIDCIALNGFNSILVCPSYLALDAAKTGGILASFEQTASLTGADVTKKYYLTADTDGFKKGDVVEYNSDLAMWVPFEGVIR